MTPFEELLSSLERAGLWAKVSDDHQIAVMRALASGEDATWVAGGAWRADGEDLADGEVEAWLSAMSGPLSDCGVGLRVRTVMGPFDAASSGYSVDVNGTSLDLYSFAPGEPGLPATEDPWLDCTVVPAAAINALLVGAGSSSRIAVFWPGGNDGFAVLGEEVVLQRANEGSGISEYLIP